MKNLQKVLCLVLAMVMMLSVMIVGVGAAKTFPDQKDIQNVEAVNMAVALNIIQGRDTGEFDPTGNVTRAEMAKMICILWNNGKEPALGTNAQATYTDINGHWAESYIEYCSSLGFVAGMGDGTFNPWGNVTGTQAAKMLLVTMGYDPNTEGFNGLNWSTQIDVAANYKGLYDGMTSSFAPNSALSRDDAAQMMWNALQAYCVTYKTTWETVNGVPTAVKTLQEKVDANGTRKITLLEDRYDAKVVEFDFDAFRYNSDKEEWTYYMDATYETDGSVKDFAASFTSGQDFTNLYKQHVKAVYTLKSNGSVDTFYGMFSFESKVLFEGVVGNFDSIKPSAKSDKEVKFDNTTYKLDLAADNTPIHLFQNGNGKPITLTATNLYDMVKDDAGVDKTTFPFTFKALDNDDNNRVDCIVVYPFLVAKVTYAGSTNFNLEYTTANDNTVIKNEAKTSYKLDDVTTYDKMAKNDYVQVIPAEFNSKDEETIVKITDILKGKITSKRSDEIAIDSTWYNLMPGVDGSKMKSGGNISDAVVVNGYLFDADGSKSVNADDYAVVTGYSIPDTGDNKIDGVRVKLLLSDGTKVTVDAANYNPQTKDEWATKETSANMYNGKDNFNDYIRSLAEVLVTYEINSDDEYELTLAVANQGNNTNEESGFETVLDETNVEVNSSKKIKYIDDANIADEAVVFIKDGNSFKVINGAKLKTLAAKDKDGNDTITVKNAYADEASTGYESVQLAYVTSSDAVTADYYYGYVTAKPEVVSNSDNKEVYELTIWTAKGEDHVKTATRSLYAEKGSVIAYRLNDDGDIKELEIVAVTGDGNAKDTSNTGETIGTVAVTAYSESDKTIKLGSTRYELTDDTVILYINADDVTGSDGSITTCGERVVSGSTVNVNNATYRIDTGIELGLLVIDTTNNIECVDLSPT